ncbi:PolC-type DNA polymerase III [Alicyclobacillaceae bacterium I2511]|nr:PolC-type DNA polymerase III [Alicyclobacillaceae bacterium I2511]
MLREKFVDAASMQIKTQPMVRDESQVKMIVGALLELYGTQEAMSGQVISHAHWQVSHESPQLLKDNTTTGLSELPLEAHSLNRESEYLLSLSVGNELEQGRLQKKGFDAWLVAMAAQLAGLKLACQLQVEVAEEQVESLRAHLQQEERQIVAELVCKAQAVAASNPSVETGSLTTEVRPNRRYRRDRFEEGPVQPLVLGRAIGNSPICVHDIVDEMRNAVIEGRVFQFDTRVLPTGRVMVQFNVTDDRDSITAKLFIRDDRQKQAIESLQNGVYVRLQGQVQFDAYNRELVFMVQDMQPGTPYLRQDEAEFKRVELHLHTTMSALDGVTPVGDYVRQAAKWGHSAIAVTDHGGVQAFPEAYEVGRKHGVKVLLGVEAYVVDDGAPIVYHMQDRLLEETDYVVFDTETTGLNAREDTLIEIAAVRVEHGQITATFSTLIDPQRSISAKITELTGISQSMVEGQPKLAEALDKFRSFATDAVWVAHNAEFDVGFLNQCAVRLNWPNWESPVVDTLALARLLYPGEKNYRLKTLSQKFQVQLVHHHRALADAEATAKVFIHMLTHLKQREINSLLSLSALSGEVDTSRIRPFHATVMVRSQSGLRNLYELVSLAQTHYLYRTPRVPRSVLVRLRDGLLIGSGCQHGEVFQSFLRGKSIDEIEQMCQFYDFLELQPLDHYDNLIQDNTVASRESIVKIHRQIVDLGKRLAIPVVASGDVHYLNPQDGIYREIFLQSQHNGGSSWQPSMHLRTTDEMLTEFQHLGEDAKAVVVTHTAMIADGIEVVKPIPDELFTPVIEGAEIEMEAMAYAKARELYGNPLPEIVEKRLRKELDSITSHGFSVIYLIAHKLVVKSLSDGYLVGSRGSVGSSLVATMTDITEVNPLAPHYRCPECKYTEFIEDGSVGSGYDLVHKECPRCNTELVRDGQNIPFETFMGFHGDKVPDIDLNFSGEYQPRAHRYTEELFGKDHVFRAGTISGVAEKTAYGYVKKFSEERGLTLRNAEIDRLVLGCTGVKRTTGQHPGGQVVVPGHKSVYDFTPVQYPADDKSTGTLTTHFDYHSGLEKCLLKLDILGHDDPTAIRMLQDLTEVDPKTIPLDDPAVLGLFAGTDSLGVNSADIRSSTGTYGIPEFGTKFVRQMLEDTHPTTFSELVRISGLSHGTDVWLNNAQELIRNKVASLSEVICARDDIMIYLIYKGLEPSRAFKIMESIRKGKGVSDVDAQYMQSFGVPAWYVESGKKIKYMFPKAHASAYVLMAMRIAWFKVYYPLPFYATYFTVRADDFDIEAMVQGKEAIVHKIEEIEEKGNTASAKEKGLQTVLELALETVVRGYRFLPLDLYRSDATRFLIEKNQAALLPPFAAVPGIGETAAHSLQRSRDEGPFLSVEDLQSRSKVSRAVVDVLEGLGCLAGLPESNQLSLF